MNFGVAQVDQVLLELVLVRVWVAIEAEQVNLDVRRSTVCELAIAAECESRAVGILVGI
jgi:hypothetical protein